MKTLFNTFCILVVVTTILLSCSSEISAPMPDPNKKGSMKLEFEHLFGTESFELLKRMNLTDSITVSVDDFKYYVSNIVFTKSDGSKYVIPQDSSYFLIDASKIFTKSITLRSIPEGDYTAISFILGIDSARSVSPVDKRTGVLDVSGEAKSMYWTWNSGYIFFAFEGTYSSPKVLNNSFKYHIGGFGGYNAPNLNNIKTISIPFGTAQLKIRDGKYPHLHLRADIATIFKGEDGISIEANPTVMFSPLSVNVANKYATMFEFDKVME